MNVGQGVRRRGCQEENGARDAAPRRYVFSFFCSFFFSVLNYFLSIVMTRQRLSITSTNSDTNTRPPCHNDNDKQPVRPELLTSTLGTTTITTTCSTITCQHADTIFRDNVRQMEDNRPQQQPSSLLAFVVAPASVELRALQHSPY